ncbi:hypothetical protein DFH06DRAFT_1149007 [Mycena polygramma]|nr:hypothetical protein DFH06DRAFT_1149007 [Mycena polygramma]
MDISTDHPTTPTDQPPPGSTSTDSSMTAAPQSPPTSSVPLKRPREEDDDGTAHKVQPRAVHTGQAMEKIAALEAENYALKEALRLNESTLRSLNDKLEKAKEIIEANKIQHDAATEDLQSQIAQTTQAKLEVERYREHCKAVLLEAEFMAARLHAGFKQHTDKNWPFGYHRREDELLSANTVDLPLHSVVTTCEALPFESKGAYQLQAPIATESEMEDLDLECAKTVYVAVKNEFCAWKTEYIAQLFSRIAVQDPPFVSGAMESFQIPVLEPLPNLEPDTVLFEDYDADGKLMGPATAIPLHTAEAAQSFPPHPPYQFCTPVSRSHTARMIDNQTAPFIPYPEDASFPREEYLKEFQGVQWVLDQQDPDGKYSFTVWLSNESGLLWDVSQRDLPPVIWADGSSLSPLPLNFLPTLPDPHNLFSQINNGILKFCPNLNCLTHNCRVHGTYNSQTWVARLIPGLVNYDWECLTAPIEPKEPRHTSQDLHAQAENPCENQCFLLLAEEDMDVDDHMSANCLELLQSMLKLEPDMLPCDLAVICKIECRRVFLRRQHIIKDCDVARPMKDTEGSTKSRRKRQLLVKRKPRRGLNFIICRARTPGPVPRRTVIAIGLTSIVNGVADVTQTVSAAGQAAIRPVRGTLSAVIGVASVGLPIANVIQNDVRHVMRGMLTGTFHKSQRYSRRRRVEVRPSAYGMGAFATETILPKDIVGEYVGELLDDVEENLAHRQVIAAVQYCFGMKGTTIDAQWVGNPMRFLNDSKPRRPNCQAEEMVVNDERRIVIRAAVRIEAGKELTLDYGKKYWGQSGPRA